MIAHVAGLNITAFDKPLVHDVHLGLGRGHIVGVMGPVGSGKSIFLKSLAGLMQASIETLHVDGEVRPPGFLTTRAWQSRVGFAFQNNALFDRMSLFDNVAFPLRRQEVEEAQVREQVESRLRDVGLWEHRNKYPNAMSGGMQKRAGIARATVIEPDVCLFDEPLAGLDPPAAVRIMGLIVGLVRQVGMAAVVVSNDLPVLLPICRRVLMFEHGKVVYDGTPRSLYHVATPRVIQFVDAAGGAAL